MTKNRGLKMDIKAYFENNKFEDILTEELTSREVQVLSLYAVGDTTKEISEILFISKTTVETHIANITRKLNLDSTANRKIALCLFWHIYQHELTKIGGYKNV